MSTEIGSGVEAMTDPLLSDAERRLWFAWKRAHEVLRARVSDEVRAATGLSDPDVAILIHAADVDGPVRQNHLATLLGWDRTRLSHHLSRMEKRGFVERTKVTGGVEVRLTDAGLAVVAIVRPIHAAAVRRHLIEPFTTVQVNNLRVALERISTAGGAPAFEPSARA
ncbi:winged helix-turn-helix transcriptional regulator [Paenarthrobacter sp. Z7-10]|uniref:MarR family winged helix-turn-helix transcriptional regulator n=1 Tax=Paenarthrobacter sp. Z7-10 TaxID=2787635 RepID=UPI0022A92D8D|nr:MarR family winged helix-turn-helix transcriptional regulator [Paenarthrobacter sp. Z7-10]MCZ2404843.1 winged helix-turn-helix transcriptional regulator [Paenarthrobacter sp. Z7-10]